MVFIFWDNSERDAVELVVIYLSVVAEDCVYGGLQVVPVETLYLVLDNKTIILTKISNHKKLSRSQSFLFLTDEFCLLSGYEVMQSQLQ